MNYYYKELMIVKEDTINVLAIMPDQYAAMSPPEFFAELYAVFYDVEDDDYKKLPKDVKQWLETNIGRPDTDGD